MNPADISNFNIFGIAIIIVISLLTLILPRQYAALPILIGVSYITLGQVLIVSGLHFTAMRLMILAGWIRIVAKRELGKIVLNKIDKTFIWFMVTWFLAYILLRQTKEAFVYQLGVSYNYIGLYFLFRALIRGSDEVLVIVKVMSVAILPLALLMILEKSAGRNLFSVLGGVPEYTLIREGRLRCQGPFRHPILAGTFGTILMPLFVGLRFQGGRGKILSLLGFASSTAIMVLSASSGPFISYILAIVALFMWRYRNRMKIFRWGLVLSIVSLHMVMKAPVWDLIARVSELTGGTGWHRSYLISQAISHFGDWWLLGVTNTSEWFPYALTDTSADITNQFIYLAIEGGLFTLILFISYIVKCFRAVGVSRVSCEKTSVPDAIFIWSIGVSLLAHNISFISVTYFDQMIVYWFMTIAFIIASKFSIENPDAANKNGSLRYA